MDSNEITAADIAEWMQTGDPDSPLANPNLYTIYSPDRVLFAPPRHPETYGVTPITVETFTKEDGTRAYKWRTGNSQRTGLLNGGGSALGFVTSLRDYLMGRC